MLRQLFWRAVLWLRFPERADIKHYDFEEKLSVCWLRSSMLIEGAQFGRNFPPPVCDRLNLRQSDPISLLKALNCSLCVFMISPFVFHRVITNYATAGWVSRMLPSSGHICLLGTKRHCAQLGHRDAAQFKWQLKLNYARLKLHLKSIRSTFHQP